MNYKVFTGTKFKQNCTQQFIYYKLNNVLKWELICFISDDLLHDEGMAYNVMKLMIEHVKNNISQEIDTIHYFSDECAGQYKNCKHFINICYHEQGFAMKCTWSFFATSHSESSCDGIGGTVKRLT